MTEKNIARNVVPQNLRIDYGIGSFNETDALADAVAQFTRWFDDALAAGLPEVNAMTLATADASGTPSARIVLLKDFDERGFTFFTNYHSRKGRDLDANPRASLVFYWQPLERQVSIDALDDAVDREESEAYFKTRPVAARIGAWASSQSEVIASREALERRDAELEKRFADGNVPLPPHWGGYRVVPSSIEFWQGRSGRLHDRLRYRRDGGDGWILERLSP